MKLMNKPKAQAIKIVATIVLMLTPSVCFAQANAHMLSGVNAQIGISYTMQAADQIKLTTFNNPNPVAVTLPAATTPNFGAGTLFSVRNLGTGTVTITAASGFIDNANTLVLTQGQGADIYSDGSNYFSQKGTGANITGMSATQVAIAASPNSISSSKAIQGAADANILGAGTVSGVTQPLCTDANGGATTVGCPAGGGASPAAPNFQAQVYNTGNLASTPCLNVSAPSSSSAIASMGCDTSATGPNPVVDIRAFGARPCDTRFAPCNTGDVATISLGTPTQANVNTPSDFIKGDGFVIYGAGPTTMTTAPTGLTAAQSVSYAGMETGFTTPSATGASTRCYKVAARNINGAQSPASTETCITNALAAEGPTINTISSATRSGQTVTLVTTAAHPFLVGCNGATNCGMVFVSSGLSDGSMRGWYAVLTAPNSTTITYQTQDSTVFGGVSSASGGQITSYPCVHLTWTAPASGTPWGYEIYEGASNAETLIDVSQPQGTNTNLVYDDYGSTMLTGVTNQLPLYLSNTPPVSAIAENLFGTIINIVSNTLTMSVTASTAVANATIRLDAGRAIAAAAATISGAGTHAGSLYIPALNNGTFFQYEVNAPVDLRSVNVVFDQAGPLYLNEPIAMGTTNNPAISWYGNRHPQYGGSFGVASPGNHSVITVEKAQPGIYINSGNGVHFEGLTVQGNTSCTNGVRGVVMESGFRSFFIDDTFAGCSGSNDNVSIPLMFRGINSLTVTDFVLDRVGFSPGQGGGGGDGATATPVWFCHFCGNSTLGSIYVVNRGFEYDLGNNGQANVNVVGPLHINGGQMPLFMTTSVIGNGPTGFQISLGSGQTQNVLMDTIAHPCVAGLGLFPPSVTGPCFTSGTPDVSGQPTYRQRGNYNSQSPNTDYWSGAALDGGGTDSARIYNYRVATGETFFVNQIAPPAPTCTVNSGGSLAIGPYTFKVEPAWQDSLQGNQSAASTTCTTSTGNQSITINWTVPTGNPLGMNLYYNFNSTGYASSNTFSFPFPVTTTSFVFSAPPGFNAHFLGFEPRSGPTVISAAGVYTPNLVLGGSSLTSAASGIILTAGTGSFQGSIPSQQFTFYDNFNRANNPVGTGAPITWVQASGTSNVVTNFFQAISSGVQNQAVVTSPAVPNDQFAEFTLLGGPIQAQVRATQTAPLSAYECSANQGSAPQITMLNSNTFSTLATGTGTISIGDVIRCEVEGSVAPYTIRYYQNGILNVSVTDSTIASGFPGIRAFSFGPGVDNFSAGGLRPLAKLTTEQDWTLPQHFVQAITIGTTNPINGSLAPGIYNSLWSTSSSVCTDTNFKLTTSGCAGGSISGLTAGQVAIAGGASSITSSKPLQGTDTNVLTSSTVTAGAGNSLCTDTGSGATTTGCPTLSGMTTGQVPIAGSATTVTSSKALQGTDTNVLSSGTVSGTGATLCTDANGGATTTGCTGGSISGLVAGQVAIAGTTTTITSSKPIAGTDANILSAGTVSSSANSLLCTDANGGATTSNCSVYNTQSAATNSNIAATNMVASAPANTMYLYMWTISLTTAGTGCTSTTSVVLNVIFTDPNAAGSVTESLGQISIASGGNGTLGFVAQGVDNIYAKSGTAVQYSTTSYTPGTGCTVNPSYQVTMRLQPMT